jgi:hypothetical protein
MMKNKYKNDIDQIHAPQDLIASTKKAMKEEEEKLTKEKKNSIKIRSNVYAWRNIAIAASVCLVILSGTVGYYKVNNHIVVNPVVFEESNDLEIGISLGKIDMDDETDYVKVEQFDEKNNLINNMWKTSSSKIKGTKVYITQGEAPDSYYATYKMGENYYLVTGKEISLKKFLNYVKEKL